jgi:hypothetical protein
MRKPLLFLVALGAVLGLSALPASADGHPRKTGSLSVVHGIPDLPVDVYLNGDRVAAGVSFTQLATFRLRVGTYEVAFRSAGAGRSTRPLLQSHVGVKPGVSKSLVAHLKANGTPTLTTYYNNTTRNRSLAQVTVRHDAAAPAVDVIANDSITLIDGLKNPGQGKAFVSAGTYNVKVVADADNSVVALEADLTLATRTNTIVYAVGDLAAGSFTVIVQVLPLV